MTRLFEVRVLVAAPATWREGEAMEAVRERLDVAGESDGAFLLVVGARGVRLEADFPEGLEEAVRSAAHNCVVESRPQEPCVRCGGVAG